jgi:hypothetical protein
MHPRGKHNCNARPVSGCGRRPGRWTGGPAAPIISAVPDDLHDDDVLLWSRRQADLLRRLAAGERINEQIDWANVIDEIDDVGNNAQDVVEGCLVQAIAHLMKLAAWPASRSANHWRSEAVAALGRARRRCKGPTLRNAVRDGLPGLHKDALAIVRALGPMDGVEPVPLRDDAILPLEDLVAEEPDLARLAERLGSG